MSQSTVLILLIFYFYLQPKVLPQNTDFDAMNLMYSQRGVPNGEFIFTQNKSVAYQFKQRDIAEGHISFRHRGSVLHSRAVIGVTDGQFYTTSMFEVQASNPYVKIINNTGIFAKSGNSL
jgi:chondroitin sulfate proteoglycan 4